MSHRIAAKITGVAGYVPPKVLTNADLEKMVDTNDEWIRTRTGIRERHLVENGMATSDMATEAAKQLLAQTNTDPTEIDLIVLASVTPDMFFPATACLVQDRLGAKRAWGFDLSAACSGFAYALTVGAQFVGSGAHKKVLVIGSDAMSKILDYKDRATCVLFGDGAGAVLLEAATDGEGILDFEHDVDGSGGNYLYMPGGGSLNPSTRETVEKNMHVVHQDGSQVFKYAVRRMADLADLPAEAQWIYQRRSGAGHSPPGQFADHSRDARTPRRGRFQSHGEYRPLWQHDRGHASPRHAGRPCGRPAAQR